MRLRAISVVAAFVIILAVVTISGLIYTIYVNQKYSISTRKGVAIAASVSFSNSYNKNTKVGLSNGYTAKVKWDGKAVGVVAIAGEYIKIAGTKYWYTRSVGYGTKAKGCPWYARITGATRYGAQLVSQSSYRLGIIDHKYTKVVYSSKVENFLKKILGAGNIVRVGGYLLVPVSSEEWHLRAQFDFYYGHSGWFGGCPQLNYHHTGYIDTIGIVSSTP